MLEQLQRNEHFQHKVNGVKLRLNEVKRQLSDKKECRQKSFQGLSKGLLDEAQFEYMQQQYHREITELEAVLVSLEQEAALVTETLTPANKWLQQIKSFSESEALTYEMAHTLIDRIVIGEGSTVHISLRYIDECQRLIELVLEHNKEAA